jgi:antitoxin PrlF
MKKIHSGKMTSKGQVTIPQEIRQRYDLSEGDRLEFVLHEKPTEYLIVMPVKRKSIADVAGSLYSPIKVTDLSSAREQVIDHHLLNKYGRNSEDSR